MSRIGLITYHSAYNFGSVLQAYATQCAVQKISGNVEVINYRMMEQKKFYSLYRVKYGIKTLLKDMMQFPLHSQRRRRRDNFEKFIHNRLSLTDEVSEPDEVYRMWSRYDIIISGSDQIWNKHSNELENNKWEYMFPYLLHGFSGKKVSYASSIANAEEEDIGAILPEIKTFDAISIRESGSADRLQKYLDMEIKYVADPTFLLTRDEWIRRLSLKEKPADNYVLYYSLKGIAPTKERIPIVKEFAKRRNCKVKVITPFVYIKSLYGGDTENCIAAGPAEFMDLIYNAQSVITDSYHGTILSINLGKDVFSLCECIGSEFRKTDIMRKLGMTDRIIYDINRIADGQTDINYSEVERKLTALREESMKYLIMSLEGER